MSAHVTTRTTGTNTKTLGPFDSPVLLKFCHIEYTSDATAGNRQISLELLDVSGNRVGDWHAGTTQAASLVRHYEYMPGIYRETSFIDNVIQCPFPIEMVVPPNHTLKIYDENAVSGSDSMVIGYQYKKNFE